MNILKKKTHVIISLMKINKTKTKKCNYNFDEHVEEKTCNYNCDENKKKTNVIINLMNNLKNKQM